jgi:phosphatidylserine decarboxylase
MIEKTGSKYAVAFPQWEAGQENKRVAKPSYIVGTLCEIGGGIVGEIKTNVLHKNNKWYKFHWKGILKYV